MAHPYINKAAALEVFRAGGSIRTWYSGMYARAHLVDVRGKGVGALRASTLVAIERAVGSGNIRREDIGLRRYHLTLAVPAHPEGSR